MKRHWLCNLIGHRYDATAAWYYWRYYCQRCGAEEPDPAADQPWHMRWLGRWRWGLECWWRDARERFWMWWKCPDCGWRFGRHDPDDEHLPF